MKNKIKKVAGVGAAVMVIGAVALWLWGGEAGGCNVAYVKLRGEVVTYVPVTDATSTSSMPADETASEDVTQSIRDAERDDSIRAIVLEIDSPGGSPVGGEEIYTALRNAHKPTVALIRDMGDSAAYMSAAGAGTIFASAFSDVGDIGITSSYVDSSKQDQKEGLTFHQLSIGTYKDMGNSDKPLTPAEQDIIMGQLRMDYERFVQMVADGRHLSTSTVTALADGSSVTGQTALADGLIDRIGNIDTVREYLSKMLGTRAVVCGIDE